MNNIKSLLLTLAILSSGAFADVEKGLEFKYEQGEGTLHKVKKIKKLSVLSNLNVPKGVFMSLMGTDSTFPSYSALNADFGANLYEIIYKINKQNNLVDATTGVDQDIDFVVAGSDKRLEVLVKKIEAKLGPESLEYFNIINTETLFLGGLNLDRWMQDWGEFLGYGKDKNGEEVAGIYYVNRDRGLKKIVEEISMMLDLPFIESASPSGISGNYGGNIEMTPDGTLLFGDTMDSKQSKQMIRKNGRVNYAKVDTSWLSVGHFDEQMSVIPSVKECKYPADYKGPKANYAIVVADPIWGLKEIYKYKGNTKYITYLAEYNPEMSEAIIVSKDQEEYFGIRKLKKAIRYYLEDTKTFTFKNTTNKKNKFDRNSSKFCTKTTKLPRRYCDLIAYNIYVAKIIDQNEEIVKSKTPCKNDHIVKVPQIYREVFYSGNPEGAVSFLPGTANMVVLRDNLIVPTTTFDGYQQVVHDQLGKAVGGNEKVHFIMEKAEYHDLMGEVHCGTNVFRELNLQIPNI